MTENLIEGVYSPDDFFRNFATAILSWQGIEHELYILFLSCVRPNNANVAGAIFYDQPSFGQKLKLVESAMKVATPDTHKQEWKRLLKEIKSASVDRNILAHLTAAADFQDDNSFDLAMVAPLLSPPEIRRVQKRKYNTAGCNEVRLEFEALENRIKEFTAGINFS
jgi:hypothetical protein